MAQKQRYVILDVLRGIAGLSIPMLHLQECFACCSPLKWSLDFCGHVYLAVEFFLLLMGYMLGYAYDRRWTEGMTLWDFTKRRLRRLHPFVISGTVLGLAVLALQLCGFRWVLPAPDADPWVWTWAVVSGLLLLPAYGSFMLAPLNACSWTLYYEYIGNILYALFVRRMGKVMLALAAVLSAGAMVFVALNMNVTLGSPEAPVLSWFKDRGFSFDGGWELSVSHFAFGMVRLMFPLFFGLLLSRLGWKIRLDARIATPLCALVFVALLFWPGGTKLGAPDYPWINGAYELFAAFVVLPTLLLIGVGSEAPGGRFAAVASFFAELSYPVYMTHYMFMPLFRYWTKYHSASHTTFLNVLVFAVAYLALLAIGWGVMTFWDRVYFKRPR